MADDSVKLEAAEEFVVTYLNPCLDPQYTTITAVDQTQPESDKYSDSDITFTYAAYTVEPDLCTLTVTCEGVENPMNDVFDGTLVDVSCPENPFSGTLT